jgi:glycine oxidase
MQRFEIVIVGAGIVGCAVARALALAGKRVALFERGSVGGESSSAAAGMLGVQGETEHEAMLRLGARSRQLYPTVVAALRAETGVEIEFWTAGTLYLCFDEDDERALAQRRAWQQAAGFTSEILAREQVVRLEPNVSRRVRSAALFRLDARVDAAALTAAYGRAAVCAGAQVFEREAVRGVVVESGRVVGVETEARRVACDLVVNTSGAWASSLAVGRRLPIVPVRGQIIVLGARKPPFRHAIYSRRGYAVARRDGRVLLGSTRERVGFEKRVTAGRAQRILLAGLELSPELGALPFVEGWCGLRPATPDGLPVIGADPTVAGYYVACGHYRNGVLLAPITAELVCGLIEGRPDPSLAAMSLERFAAEARRPREETARNWR